MIIVDEALKARAAAGDPVRVGMVGAGFMGRGIANSILRSFPGMRLVGVANRTEATALRAYTVNNAWAAGEESLKGRLAPGLLADLVVVDRDPFAVPPAELRNLKVLLTITGGRVVFDAAKDPPAADPATAQIPRR